MQIESSQYPYLDNLGVKLPTPSDWNLHISFQLFFRRCTSHEWTLEPLSRRIFALLNKLPAEKAAHPYTQENVNPLRAVAEGKMPGTNSARRTSL